MKDIKTAVQLIETGQIEEGYELLKGKINERTKDDHIFTIAEIFEELGYIEDAIKLFTRLYKKFPNEGQLIVKLAELYIETKQDEQAIELLEGIDQFDDFYVHALLLLADLFERQGLFEVAEQKLFEAKEYVSEEEVYIIDFALAELLFSVGEANRAITFYERILQTTDEVNDVEIKERICECYALIGKYEQALYFYDQLNQDTPNRLFKHGFIANQAKETTKAIQLWNQLIDMDPNYTSVYYELALAYEEEQLWKEALNVLERGMTYDEFDKRLYYLAGKMHINLKDRQKAYTALNKAIELDNDYHEAIMLTIDLLKEDHQPEEIINLLSSIKKSGATDPTYDWELAKAYAEIESYSDARKLYEKAYYHLQKDSAFLKEYGFFLVEEGRIKEAIPILKKYVTIEPEDEETFAFLERLHFSNDVEM